MDYKTLLMDVGKNAMAVGIVQMVDLVDKVPLQRSEASNRLKQGATYTLARDLVNFWSTGQSDVLNMNYRHLVDSTVWNGASGYMFDRSGLARIANEAVAGVSPFDSMVNDALVDGTAMTVSNTLRDYAETNPTFMNTPLRYVLQPTSLLF